VKKIRWETPPRRIPKHPYRDSAVLYAVLAGVVVGVTALTNGDVGRSVILAVALFVAATTYAWWRWRERIRREAERE
jgi:Flp pilus assembly protein TadB